MKAVAGKPASQALDTLHQIEPLRVDTAAKQSSRISTSANVERVHQPNRTSTTVQANSLNVIAIEQPQRTKYLIKSVLSNYQLNLENEKDKSVPSLELMKLMSAQSTQTIMKCLNEIK